MVPNTSRALTWKVVIIKFPLHQEIERRHNFQHLLALTLGECHLDWKLFLMPIREWWTLSSLDSNTTFVMISGRHSHFFAWLWESPRSYWKDFSSPRKCWIKIEHGEESIRLSRGYVPWIPSHSTWPASIGRKDFSSKRFSYSVNSRASSRFCWTCFILSKVCRKVLRNSINTHRNDEKRSTIHVGTWTTESIRRAESPTHLPLLVHYRAYITLQSITDYKGEGLLPTYRAQTW